MKPTKCLAKEKKSKAREVKEEEKRGEKAKSKGQDCCVHF